MFNNIQNHINVLELNRQNIIFSYILAKILFAFSKYSEREKNILLFCIFVQMFFILWLILISISSSSFQNCLPSTTALEYKFCHWKETFVFLFSAFIFKSNSKPTTVIRRQRYALNVCIFIVFLFFFSMPSSLESIKATEVLRREKCLLFLLILNINERRKKYSVPFQTSFILFHF